MVVWKRATALPSHGQMAVKKENLDVETAAARVRPIELITENGFSIVRATEFDGRRPLMAGKYEFVVCDADGNQLEITVEIDGKVVIEITLRSRGRISSQSSYWICCAERHLADYLWEEDIYPPDGKLTVEELTLEDLNLAIRWGKT
jgi:hypothetical protein